MRDDTVNLPSPEGEVACLIDATLDVNGELVDVISVHFGNTQHFWDRRLQAEDVVSRIKAKKAINRPALWLGYLTGLPGSANYNAIINAGMKDIKPGEGDRYCLYHFYMGLEPSNFQRIPNRIHRISDTEIQYADYRLPTH